MLALSNDPLKSGGGGPNGLKPGGGGGNGKLPGGPTNGFVNVKLLLRLFGPNDVDGGSDDGGNAPAGAPLTFLISLTAPGRAYKYVLSSP